MGGTELQKLPMPCWYPANGPFLHPGPSGFGENRAGLLPQEEGAKPRGCGWDAGNLGTVLCVCYSSMNLTTTPHPPMCGSLKHFLVTLWKSPVSTSSTITPWSVGMVWLYILRDNLCPTRSRTICKGIDTYCEGMEIRLRYSNIFGKSYSLIIKKH